jgi:predicted TIM-barrel fold metal-dependent hydrolase
MINRRRGETTMPESVLREFDAAAARIADAGAVAFGEMTCEHFSGLPGHPYVSAPPDHPLFLRLAEIAAERGLPIDMHMEAVPADMDMPASFRRSSVNPAKVAGNIARFERLLAHNRKASIIWVHLGWDVTGHRTVELTRALLQRNENLYMQVRPLPPAQPGQALHPLHNFVLFADLRVGPAWVALMTEFPGRFVIGSDSFYVAPSADPRIKFAPPLPFARPFVNGLPPELAAKVAHENAVRLYRLPAV